MSADELVPFAESLGIPGGDLQALEPFQRALLEDLYGGLESIDRRELRIAALRTGREQERARMIAALLLQGDARVQIATTDRASAERLYRRVLDELELAGRTLSIDVEPALERARRDLI